MKFKILCPISTMLKIVSIMSERHIILFPICTSNTMGIMKSRDLLRYYLNFGPTCSLIKGQVYQSIAWQSNVFNKVTTPIEFLFSWIEVTMKDTLLHGFDETRRMYQHLYLVFDNDTCYDIILDINFWPRWYWVQFCWWANEVFDKPMHIMYIKKLTCYKCFKGTRQWFMVLFLCIDTISFTMTLKMSNWLMKVCRVLRVHFTD